jgi:hypothetical protein
MRQFENAGFDWAIFFTQARFGKIFPEIHLSTITERLFVKTFK